MKTFILIMLTLMTLSLTAVDYKIIKSDSGEELSLSQMATELLENDVLFFGELHDDSLLHSIEQELFILMAEQDSNLVLSMEMFEKDNQDGLNRYLSGEYSPEQFETDVRLWDNFATDYDTLLTIAKKYNRDVIAANVPRKYSSRVVREGLDFIGKLPPEERIYIARDIKVLDDTYKDNFFNTMSSLTDRQLDDTTSKSILERLYQAQVLKDDTMAETLFDYLEENRAAKVLHINGDFHSSDHFGTTQKLEMLNPNLKVSVISPITFASTEELQWHFSMYSKGDYVILYNRDEQSAPMNDKGSNAETLAIKKHILSFVAEPKSGIINVSDKITLNRAVRNEPLLIDRNIAIVKITANGKEVPYKVKELNDHYRNLVIESKVTTFTVVYIYQYPLDDMLPSYIGLDEYRWYPIVAIGEKSIFEVNAIAPNLFKFVAQGEETISQFKEDSIYYTWKTKIPVYGMSVIGDLFNTRSFVVDDTRVTIYCYPNEYALTEEYEYAFTQYFKDYEEYFGPFDHSSFSLVQSSKREYKYFQNVLVVDNEVFKNKDIFTSPGVLGHDLARMWLNSKCTWNEEEGNWTEMLSNFIANYYWLEKNREKEAPLWRKDALEDITVIPHDEIKSLYDFKGVTNKFDAINGYKISAMILHQLKDEVGAYKFFKSIQNIIDNNSSLSGKEFFEKLFTLTESTRTEKYIENLYPAKIYIKSAYVENGVTYITIIQSNSDAYDFDLEIKLENRENFIIAKHRIDSNVTKLEFGFVAEDVTIDPDYKLYRYLSNDDNIYRLKRTFHEKPLFIVQQQGPKAMDVYELANTLRKNGLNLDILPVSSINDVEWAERSMIVVGAYDNNPMFKALENFIPREFSYDDVSFTFGEEVYSSDRYSLLINYPNPLAPGKSISMWLWNDSYSVGTPNSFFNYTEPSWVILEWNGVNLEEVIKGKIADDNNYPTTVKTEVKK